MTTAIPGVGLKSNFGTVVGNRYDFIDRNNAALNVVATATSAFGAQIKGLGADAFAGLGFNS